MDPKTKSDVADAAMNLVDMVTSSVGGSQLALQNTTNQHLADIKTGLNGLDAGMKQGNDVVIHHLAEIKEKVVNLEAQLKEQQTLQKLDFRMKRIEFALQNISLVVSSDFAPSYVTKPRANYHNSYYQFSSKNGSDLIKRILLWFRREMGMFVTDYVILRGASTYDVTALKQEWTDNFKTELESELHALLGKKPRFETYKDGRLSFFYE